MSLGLPEKCSQGSSQRVWEIWRVLYHVYEIRILLPEIPMVRLEGFRSVFQGYPQQNRGVGLQRNTSDLKVAVTGFGLHSSLLTSGHFISLVRELDFRRKQQG